MKPEETIQKAKRFFKTHRNKQWAHNLLVGYNYGLKLLKILEEEKGFRCDHQFYLSMIVPQYSDIFNTAEHAVVICPKCGEVRRVKIEDHRFESVKYEFKVG